MNKTKRFCAIALAAMMAASALAACGQGNTTSTAPAASTGGGEETTSSASDGGSATVEDPLYGEGANGTISLKVWGPDSAQDVLKSQCAQFIEDMKPYGTIEIEVVPQGEDVAATNVLTDASAAADVFGFACDNLDRLVTAGTLLEVVEADKNFVVENNSESSVNAASIDDQLWAFPETGDNSYILVYNKDYVSDDQAKTLEGVLEACKAANKNFVMDAGNGFYSCMFMFTGGLTIDGFEDDGVTQKFSDYDEEKVVKTLKAFQDLFQQYKDNILLGDVSKVVDGFQADTAAAGIDGSWNFSAAKEALKDKAGFAVLPTINVDGQDEQIVNMFGYKLIGVNASTAYPSTATELAKYLTSEKCQQERAEQLNWGPSNKAVAQSDVITSDAALSAILAQAEYSVAQKGIANTFWSPMGTLGAKITDFDNPMSEDDIKTLITQTIANIKDE